MLAAYIKNDTVDKEVMAWLLAGFDLPIYKPFKNYGDWMEYSKWYSVVCNTYSKSLDDIGINVSGEKCEFNKGIGPVIADAAAPITYAQALQIADQYKPDLGYQLRKAHKERSEMYAPDPVQLSAPPKPLWELRRYKRGRANEKLRFELVAWLKTKDPTKPPPNAAELFGDWSLNPPRGCRVVADELEFENVNAVGAKSYVTSKSIDARIARAITLLN